MGNTTKPSSLWLVQSHHDFDNPGTLFETKMLKWPIYGRTVHPEELDEGITIIYRNAMEGLMNIAPFSAKLSFEIYADNKTLFHPKRTWGKIYLNSDEHVLDFSHCISNNNQAFCSILEWPEVKNTDGNIVTMTSPVVTTLSTWSANQWREFFWERIKQEVAALEKKAEAKRNDAIALENRAIEIRSALSKK